MAWPIGTFSITVSHVVGKYLALADYLSSSPSTPRQADDAYDEDYVINHFTTQRYKFVTKYGYLSEPTSEPKNSNKREQTAITSIIQLTKSFINSVSSKKKMNMDAGTIDNLKIADPSAKTRNLISNWEKSWNWAFTDNLAVSGKNTTSQDSSETGGESSHRRTVTTNPSQHRGRTEKPAKGLIPPQGGN